MENFILFAAFHLQKYFEEKVGADEKVVGARTHLGKGFAGKYYINITLEKLEDPF